MKTLVLSLLLASAAAAQPFVAPEVQSVPIESLGDTAVTPAGDGFIVAWSQGDHLNVAHLDATLHETDTPFAVSLSSPTATATFVTLATNGKSILLSWKEQRPGYVESTYAATLTFDAKALLATPRFVDVSPYAPAVGVRDGKYVLVSGDESLVLTDNLDSEAFAALTSTVSGAVSSRGDAGSVSVSVNKAYACRGCQFCFPTCSTLETYTFTTPSVTKTLPIAYGPTVEMRNPPIRDPIIAADGDHFVGLAVTSTETDVFELTGREAGQRWTLDPPASGIITLAGNGSDVLVVWWGAPALRGILLHSDGSTSAPFVIAENAYSTPKIVVASSNEFVVTYRYDVDRDRATIAGRVIRLREERQRAVR